MKRHTPVRQCAACRQRAGRDDLIRLVRAPSGVVVVDLRARLPGRGAWVHPRPACLERLESRPGLLSRALRDPVTVEALEQAVRDAIWAATLDGLSLAAAAGGLIGGHDALVAALRSGEVVELVSASDASERTLQSLLAASEVTHTPLPIDRATLGNQVGGGTRAALGILDVPACTHLRRQLQRLRQLG